jgi:hypothetical protein
VKSTTLFTTHTNQTQRNSNHKNNTMSHKLKWNEKMIRLKKINTINENIRKINQEIKKEQKVYTILESIFQEIEKNIQDGKENDFLEIQPNFIRIHFIYPKFSHQEFGKHGNQDFYRFVQKWALENNFKGIEQNNLQGIDFLFGEEEEKENVNKEKKPRKTFRSIRF